MTENKLTLEDCFKYYKATIIYEQEKFFGIGDFFRCSNPTLNISDCKLILRDLSQLTFEEKLYIYDTFCNNYEEDKALLKDTFDNFMEILAYCGTENAVDLADYLRSKGIMIEKPDWFEIGKAVKG